MHEVSEKILLTVTDGQLVASHELSCPRVASGIAARLEQPGNPQEAEVVTLKVRSA